MIATDSYPRWDLKSQLLASSGPVSWDSFIASEGLGGRSDRNGVWSVSSTERFAPAEETVSKVGS